MSNLCEVHGVTKVFRNGSQKVTVLSNVSFSVAGGEYVSIVGPSGAGKSTLLHVMGGLEPPTQGKMRYQRRDIYRMAEGERSGWRNKTVGFVFQFYHLIEELRVEENVVLPCVGRKRKSSLKKARELLQYLGIEERMHFFPFQLSGGQRQKVAFARALINDPEILLCDEPTGNLDKESQLKIIALLERLNTQLGKTVIVVTHNRELAQAATRMLRIEGGKVQ